MYGFGLRIPDDEKTKIATYLGTCLGPNPAPPPKAKAVAEAPVTENVQTLFGTSCSACHQKTGKGVPGAFPPLAGNRDLFLDRLFPVHVVLHGLQGPVTVEGKKVNGTMPNFAHMKDGEIAAILNYVRGAWGNDKGAPKDMAPLAAADVTRLRSESQSAKDVHALRESLKK